jgi:hypothetical protein
MTLKQRIKALPGLQDRINRIAEKYRNQVFVNHHEAKIKFYKKFANENI